jgi:hypothetical protein
MQHRSPPGPRTSDVAPVLRPHSVEPRINRSVDAGIESTVDRAYTRRYLDDAEGAELSKPTVLAILALPAGAIGYALTTLILSGLALPDGARAVVLMIVPLFVAGLCMVPFLLPVLDRTAKRDLAAHRAQQASEDPDGKGRDEPPRD